MSSRGGTSVRHGSRPLDTRQRGWNEQPVGRSIRFGGEPGIGSSRCRSTSSRGRLLIRPRVYGWRGAEKIDRASATSTTLPPYMTTTRSACSAISPRSWVMRMVAAFVRSCAVRRTSRTCAWIVTARAAVGSPAGGASGAVGGGVGRLRDVYVRWGGRVVGDEGRGVVGDGHRDHRALPHTAGVLVRVLVVASRGVGHADHGQQLDQTGPRPRAARRGGGPA